jgi:hypothetical protein
MSNDTKKPGILNRLWNAFADLFPGEREPLLDNVKPRERLTPDEAERWEAQRAKERARED